MPTVGSYTKEKEGLFGKVKGAGLKGLGVVSDVLSSPVRLIGGTIDDINRGDIGGAVNVFDNALDRENDPSQLLGADGLLGLGLDIVLDPVTWATGGVAAVSKAGAKAGVKSFSRESMKSALKRESGEGTKSAASIIGGGGKQVQAQANEALEDSFLKGLRGDTQKSTEDIIKRHRAISEGLKKGDFSNNPKKLEKAVRDKRKMNREIMGVPEKPQIRSDKISESSTLISKHEDKLKKLREKETDILEDLAVAEEMSLSPINPALIEDIGVKIRRSKDALKRVEKQIAVAEKSLKAAATKTGMRASKVSDEGQSVIKNMGANVEDAKQAYIGLRAPYLGGVGIASRPIENKLIRETIGKAPLGAPVIKAADRMGDLFIPGHGVDKSLYNESRAATGLALADATIDVDRLGLSKAAKNITGDQRSILNSIVKTVAESETPVKEAALSSSKNSRGLKSQAEKEVNKLYNQLNDKSKEWLNNYRKYLSESADELEARGLLPDGKRQGIYFPTFRSADKLAEKAIREGASTLDDGLEIATASQAPGLYGTKSIQKSRLSKNFEDTDDIIRNAERYIIDKNEAVRNYDLVESIGSTVGRSFTGKTAEIAAREAEKAGYVRPTNKAVKDILGEDVFIPKEVNEGIQRLNAKTTNLKEMNSVSRSMEKATGLYRTLAYTVAPGRLTVDAIGDFWNLSLAGIDVLNPTKLSRGIKITKDVNKFIRGNAKDKKVNLGGHEIKLSQLADYTKANNLLAAGRSQMSQGQWTGKAAIKGYKKGDPRRASRNYSTFMERSGRARDNYTRIPGFIAALEQELKHTKDIHKAMANAGKRVKEAVFDYTELTPFERKVMRNIMPFYTWTRNNVPLQLRKLAEAPAGFNIAYETQEASNEAAGIPEGASPDYMRRTFFGLPGLGKDGNPLAINPMLPPMDLTQFQNFRTGAEEGPAAKAGIDGSGIISVLNPVFRAPMEYLTGKEAYTGREIESTPSYILRTLGGQVGGIAQFAAKEGADKEGIGLKALGFSTGLRNKRLDMDKSRIGAVMQYQAIMRNKRKEMEKERLNWINRVVGGD